MLTPAALRMSLAFNLRDVATGVLLDPGLNKKKPEQVRALVKLYDGLRELVLATSSSNRGFEFSDLPLQEREAIEQAKHAIGLLDLTVLEPLRPQAAP